MVEPFKPRDKTKSENRTIGDEPNSGMFFGKIFLKPIVDTLGTIQHWFKRTTMKHSYDIIFTTY